MPNYCDYYHWTHKDNLPSINKSGLQPAYATGKLKAVWVVSRTRVEWAALHVAARHGWTLTDIVLIRVRVHTVHTTRTRYRGIRHRLLPVPVDRLTVLGSLTDWLRDQEPDPV